MKLYIKEIIGLSVVAMCICTTGFSQPKVSPFTDNLTVNTKNFPSGGTVSYHSDNGINISGSGALSSSFQVHISSQNLAESGYPSMTVQVSGASCTLQFIDGPWVSLLSYKDGQPPVCSHIVAHDIQSSGQYTYQVELDYQS